MPVITAIASSCLVNRDTLADINPMLESDGNIVPMPPEQSAFSNCEKVVECDEEAYRKKAQSNCMYSRVRLADIVSHNAQFWAGFKKQHPICEMSDHLQSNSYVAALALVLEEARDAAPTISLRNCLEHREPYLTLNGLILVE